MVGTYSNKLELNTIVVRIIFLAVASDCPGFCPTVCPPEHTMCPGGSDPASCPKPDICMPITIGIDGVVCPVSCPVHCPEDHMWCDGGVDANGCMLPNTCFPLPSKHIILKAKIT